MPIRRRVCEPVTEPQLIRVVLFLVDDRAVVRDATAREPARARRVHAPSAEDRATALEPTLEAQLEASVPVPIDTLRVDEVVDQLVD